MRRAPSVERENVSFLFIGSQPFGDNYHRYWFFDADKKRFCFSEVPNGCKQLSGIAGIGTMLNIVNLDKGKADPQFTCKCALIETVALAELVFFSELIPDSYIVGEYEGYAEFRCYRIHNPRNIKVVKE